MQKQLEIDFAIAGLLFFPLILSLRNARLNVLQIKRFAGDKVALFVSMSHANIIQNFKDQETKQKLQGQRKCDLIHNASV